MSDNEQVRSILKSLKDMCRKDDVLIDKSSSDLKTHYLIEIENNRIKLEITNFDGLEVIYDLPTILALCKKDFTSSEYELLLKQITKCL